MKKAPSTQQKTRVSPSGRPGRTFCIAGPVQPEDHYYVAGRLARLDTQTLRQLIDEKKYFIFHAPRQTGKTTGILRLANELNVEGRYRALYLNVEPAQAARNDFSLGLRTILSILRNALELQSDFEAAAVAVDAETDADAIAWLAKALEVGQPSSNALADFLQYWSRHSKKPIVLFIDEIDSLVGDTLISVLRQIRAGYTNRPHGFPQSICLTGVRDVRDFRIWSKEQGSMVLGGSAFNIKAESIRLPDFTMAEVKDLYGQHTKATGQKFTAEALAYAFTQTQGQPWLVNALAYQACFRDVTDRRKPITLEVMERSRETLILRRDTHLDVLVDRLQEPRVRHVIEAILTGGGGDEDFASDDLQYVRDLGLVSQKDILIANPIYHEVIPRELTYTKQESIGDKLAWYLRKDKAKSLDMVKLLQAFTDFYRENSEVWLERFSYKEAGPHLLLMAFLQRIINGGGKLHREYALGRGRVDLLILYGRQRIVVELKIQRRPTTVPDGLKQTAAYMRTCKATEGHLVVFDRNKDKSWDEKIFRRKEMVGGRTAATKRAITLWGL